MLENLSFIHFAGTENIIKIVAMFALAVICILFKWYKSIKAIKILALPRMRSTVLSNASFIRRAIKYSLFLIGLIFVFLSLLQPQWDKKEEQVAQQGRDLLIAVDISRSMLCTDEKPNRLEFAKAKIKKIVFNLKCERIGLIVFAGQAVMQCPLTSDFGSFFMFLDNLDTSTVSPGTTSIDGAIREGIRVFKAMPDKKTKLICLFTDGEDFSTNLAGVKTEAAQENLCIFTFGIGSESGAPIPIYDHQGKNIGFEKNQQGSIVMSKLDEDVLKKISEQTGGKYIKITKDDSDVKKFVGLVESFEKDDMENTSFSMYQQQYPYFIMVSFLCFGLEWLL